VALTDVTVAMGPLQFIDRSHTLGSLGRSFLRLHDDTPDQHPWLAAWPRTELVDMGAGDATAHSALTVHGAPENSGERPRVVVALAYFSADTLYTGAPFARTDGLGLAVNGPFDHPKFPLVPVPGEEPIGPWMPAASGR
jgi:ectoine hydroxylase-related dioxygenase (phytanoyl-CoA dioxygenase family)